MIIMDDIQKEKIKEDKGEIEKTFKLSHDLEFEKLQFEKYKFRIQIWKWVIGTICLTIITLIIDYGFRDRAASLNEMHLYDRYVTDLIVLNNKTGPRRLLAQYFSHVTASEKLKKGWIDYYNVVNKEYQDILLKDSLLAMKIEDLRSDTLSQNENEIDRLQNQRKVYEEEIRTEVKLIPNNDWEIMEKQIKEAENYYKSGSTHGKEQSLRIYYSISQKLTDLQKLTLPENKRILLRDADEAYNNNQIEAALEKYYLTFKDF